MSGEKPDSSIVYSGKVKSHVEPIVHVIPMVQEASIIDEVKDPIPSTGEAPSSPPIQSVSVPSSPPIQSEGEKGKEAFRQSCQLMDYEKEFKQDCPGYPLLLGTYDMPKRIVAIGDVHGDFIRVLLSLEEMGVIHITDPAWDSIVRDYSVCVVQFNKDVNKNPSPQLSIKRPTIPQYEWVAEQTFLIQVGDQIHRSRCDNLEQCSKPSPCDQATDRQTIELFLDLARKADARQNGSRVISLFGNHEFMQIKGGYKSYITQQELLQYKQNGEIEDFEKMYQERLNYFTSLEFRKQMACSRLLLASVGPYYFVHGGIVQDMSYIFSLTDNKCKQNINMLMRKWLMSFPFKTNEIIQGLSEASSVIINILEEQLLWDRTYGVLEEGKDLDECDHEILKNGYMIIGHTIQSAGIKSVCNKKVWKIDHGFSVAFDPYYPDRKLQYLEIKENSVPEIKFLTKTQKLLGLGEFRFATEQKGTTTLPLIDHDNMTYIISKDDDGKHLSVLQYDSLPRIEDVVKELHIPSFSNFLNTQHDLYMYRVFYYDRTLSVLFPIQYSSLVSSRDPRNNLDNERTEVFKSLVKPETRFQNLARRDNIQVITSKSEIYIGQVNAQKRPFGFGINIQEYPSYYSFTEGIWNNGIRIQTFRKVSVGK
jgi:Calcineurin-like phosphoesterase.